LSQVFNERFPLIQGQLTSVIAVFGTGVTVHALQIAASRNVPYHDGFLVVGELEQVPRQVLGAAAVTQRVRRFDSAAVEL
jgi:hypothetical protein